MTWLLLTLAYNLLDFMLIDRYKRLHRLLAVSLLLNCVFVILLLNSLTKPDSDKNDIPKTEQIHEHSEIPQSK